MFSVKKISFNGTNSGLFQQMSAKMQYAPIQNTNLPKPNNGQNSVQSKSHDLNTAKKVAYVGSALALASLCVTGVVMKKNFKAAKMIKGLGEKLTKAESEILNTKNEIKDLGKWHDGIIEGTKKEFENKIAGITQATQEVGDNFFSKIINVNGKEMKLATVFNEVSGESEKMLTQELRKEASKRILGTIERKGNPPEHITLRMPTSEIRPFTNTGGMSIVPKELISNFAALINTKQKATLLLDTPLYTGNVANNTFYSKACNLDEKMAFDGTYNYIKTVFNPKTNTSKQEVLTKLTEIDKMKLPIYTDKGQSIEEVGVLMSETLTSPIDFNLLSKRLTKEVSQEIHETLNKGGVFETDLLKICKNKETGLPEAHAKYKTVFYDSPKFNMSGRVNANENINIYRNDSISAGETERMVYFSKFFSEHLMNSDKSKLPLNADVIIGNDWQTGPISAIMRLLTTARKHYGMDPIKAEKLHNTPIITLLHNAGLSGSTWHSQDKLLNIMFGEHTAKIVENAHMPNTGIGSKGGLPQNLWNALMEGQNVNPQLMAANYSDLLVPVSEQYGVEIASHGGFGGAAHDIFKIRGRMFEYADESNLKFIAKNNGLDEKLISKEPSLKGITNGCDAMNNTLTAKSARKLEEALGLELNSIKELHPGQNVAQWHRNNKTTYLNKVIDDLNAARTSGGKNNPMNIALPEMTDLTGVTVNTPVFSTAGRIVDQKGLDIFSESIKNFYKDFKGTDYPVFYAQGVGDEVYIQKLLDVKKELSYSNPEAAKRIVFARLFTEPGRYDGCKLMSDFTIMSSWFEPCGLVHKEIAKYSGAIPIVLEVGGLTAGLKDGVNAVFAKYKHRFDNFAEALDFNAKSFSAAMNRAYEWFKKPERFAEGLKASQEADHSWLVQGGPIDKYGKLLVDLKVLKPEVMNQVL